MTVILLCLSLVLLFSVIIYIIKKQHEEPTLTDNKPEMVKEPEVTPNPVRKKRVYKKRITKD